MKTFISIIFLFVINTSFSQEFCYFSQQGDIKYAESAFIFEKFDFFVNGVFIDDSNKKNRIFINEFSLDSIRIVNNIDTSSFIIYCKLKKKEKYHIRYNVCSTFEIVPKSNDASLLWKNEELKQINKRASQDNFVRLIKEGSKKELYVDEGFWLIDVEDYKKNDTTFYYRCFSSGYCPHATSTFTVCKTKDKPDYKLLSDTSICKTIRIMFFHSEKYSIIYNRDLNQISLVLDGYFDKRNDKIRLTKNSEYLFE